MFSYLQKIAIVGLITLCSYYYYFNNKLNEEVNSLTVQNKTLSDVNDKNEKYISDLKSNITEVLKINDNLNEVSKAQDKQIEQLLIKSQKHDISKLANKKPKLIENIINKGTFREFRCIENITKGNTNECK